MTILRVCCLCFVFVCVPVQTLQHFKEPRSATPNHTESGPFFQRFSAFPYGFLFVRPAGSNPWLPGNAQSTTPHPPQRAIDIPDPNKFSTVEKFLNAHRISRPFLPISGISTGFPSWRFEKNTVKRAANLGGLTFSMTAPLDFLREKMEIEMKRRRMMMQSIEYQNSRREALRSLGRWRRRAMEWMEFLLWFHCFSPPSVTRMTACSMLFHYLMVTWLAFYWIARLTPGSESRLCWHWTTSQKYAASK